ncbi:hypothetical protein PAHAL_3G186500 [Panicum hallii]|uniref:Uncharacterized protein n=1 Tax=Panicum hallii TaxID=206008 RepID=A0A2T8KIK9_9POAL|nr:hypothetical protein PAHAL_3G186500 [Panicum hallii]
MCSSQSCKYSSATNRIRSPFVAKLLTDRSADTPVGFHRPEDADLPQTQVRSAGQLRVSSSSDGHFSLEELQTTDFLMEPRSPQGGWESIQACLVTIAEPVTLPEPKLLPTSHCSSGKSEERCHGTAGAWSHGQRLPNTKLRSGQVWQVAGLALPTWTCITCSCCRGITVSGIHGICCHHRHHCCRILKRFPCTETQTDTHTCPVPNNQHHQASRSHDPRSVAAVLRRGTSGA